MLIRFTIFTIFIICFLPMMALSAIEMKNIKFVQEGEVSKLIFEFDDRGVLVSKLFNDKERQIILDFKEVSAAQKILRAFDASEFKGSVVFVSPYKKPNSENEIRVAVQLRDSVRSKLEVKGNKIILNIENRFGVFSSSEVPHQDDEKGALELKIGSQRSSFQDQIHVPKSDSVEDILENITLSGRKKYIGKRIHFDVKDVPITDLLKMIADASGFNIIVDNAVNSSKPMTLSLVGIPWDQALDTILDIAKLVAKKNKNILIVTTIDKASEEARKRLSAEELLKTQEPLVTKIFPISYADSGELIKTLKEYATKDRGRLSFDNRTNQLIVKDTVRVIERIGRMIEVLDTQTPQILIEAKIVEASEGFSQQIGFAEGVSFQYDMFPSPDIDFQESSGIFSVSSTSSFANSPTFLGVTVNVFKRLSGLNMSLQLLEEESKGRVVSTPKVITQNKQAATITSTSTANFRQVAVVDGEVVESYGSISAPLSLTVTPQVTNEGSIIMQVAVVKSALIPTAASRAGSAPPNSISNNISTNVLVDNGSTVVIGGVYTYQESNSSQGIPLLKDIPIVGWLFRSPYAPSKQKQELIIFLTPRVINEEKSGLGAGASRENPLG